MRGSAWRKAGDLIGAVLEESGLREDIRRHSALLGWDEIVGKGIGAKARPLEIRGRTLFVQVDGSAWIHELSFMKNDIVKKLNDRVGGDAIDQIILVARGQHAEGGEPGTGRGRRDRRHE